MNKLLSTLFLLLTLVSCAGLPGGTASPGDVKLSVDEFEGHKELKMEPAWIGSGFGDNAKLGLYKSTRMDKNKVSLIVETINSVQNATEIRFKIDGKIKNFKLPKFTVDTCIIGTGKYVHTRCSKRIMVDIKFIKKLINADESTHVQLVFRNNTYINVGFKNTFTTFLKNVPEFMNKLKTIK